MLGACAKQDETPQGAFRQFADALEDSKEDPDALERAFALLSPSDRRELAQRARRATVPGGPELDGSDMLAQGRATLHFVPRKVEIHKRTRSRVELVVRGQRPAERATVVMVPEGNAWRVELGLGADASES